MTATSQDSRYSRGLEIYGTGYSVKVEGKNLVLNVGYAHTVPLAVPAGVTVNIEVAATRGNDVPARFSILGADKQVVGQFVRTIRDARPPESSNETDRPRTICEHVAAQAEARRRVRGGEAPRMHLSRTPRSWFRRVL